MYWLWIPAVALLSVFFLALCWYFFSDYRCFPCPCRKKSTASTFNHDSSILPTYVKSANSSVSSPSTHAVFLPYKQNVRADFGSQFGQGTNASSRPTILTSTNSAPSAPPSTPEDSPTVRLTYGVKKLSSIIYDDNGIPTLDLHNMTIPEAKSSYQGFLHRQRVLGSPYVQIVTGRGLHSDEGVAKIKPLLKNMIIAENLEYRETCKGGAYLVYL